MAIDNIDDDIRAAITSHKEELEQEQNDYAPEPEVADEAEVVEEKPQEKAVKEEKRENRDEKGQFKPKPKNRATDLKDAAPAAATAAPAAAPLSPPTSWTGAAKEKWSSISPDLQQEILKRENDIHQMFTRHDGELRLGREMKEVVTPYLPLIQAEGGTPAKAVQTLLNTAYILRTGTQQQKEQLIRNTAQQYGVDLSQPQQEQDYQDPVILQLQQQILGLQQQLSPDNLKNYLQNYNESSRVDSEVQAFASDPANVHYAQVAPVMAALVSSGRANNLKEAYEAACYADPQIRSTILAEQNKQAEEKRKQEFAAKKKAAVQVSGSPGSPANSPLNPKDSLEDELRAAYSAASGRL